MEVNVTVFNDGHLLLGVFFFW